MPKAVPIFKKIVPVIQKLMIQHQFSQSGRKNDLTKRRNDAGFRPENGFLLIFWHHKKVQKFFRLISSICIH
jgi:hypothetical protein